MENEKIIGFVNGAITDLCENCDPNCPKAVADGFFPHCYKDRTKVYRLMENIVKKPLTDAELARLDAFFSSTPAK